MKHNNSVINYDTIKQIDEAHAYAEKYGVPYEDAIKVVTFQNKKWTHIVLEGETPKVRICVEQKMNDSEYESYSEIIVEIIGFSEIQLSSYKNTKVFKIEEGNSDIIINLEEFDKTLYGSIIIERRTSYDIFNSPFYTSDEDFPDDDIEWEISF